MSATQEPGAAENASKEPDGQETAGTTGATGAEAQPVPAKEEPTESTAVEDSQGTAGAPVKEEAPTAGGAVMNGESNNSSTSAAPAVTENNNGAEPTVTTVDGKDTEQKQAGAGATKEFSAPKEENGDSKPAAVVVDGADSASKPAAAADSKASAPVKVDEAVQQENGGVASLEASKTIATDPKDVTAETLVILKTGEDGQTVAVMPPLQPPKHVKKGEVLKRPQNVTTVVTRNGKTWNEMFEALVSYKGEHGDCYVPDRFKNPEGVCLGLWVRNQRRREESLTADQHKRLTELGLDWQTQNERFDNTWHERYAKLTMYRVEHGDCKVPYTYKADPALAKWVSQQRAQQAQGRLAADRKAKLDAIDFSWKLNTVKNRNTKTEDKKWMRQYEKLIAFHQEHGHCKVPDRYKPDRPLGTWVKKQRLANACNQLKEDRKKMLDDLDFVWRITDKTDGEKWDKMFTKLKEYKETNGTCHVSRTVPDGDLKPLARWVKTQRALYKSGKILPDRKARLETIDFVWDGTQLPIKRKRRRPTEEGEKGADAAEMPTKKAKIEETDGDKKPNAEDAKAADKKIAAKRVLPTSSQKTDSKAETEGAKGEKVSNGKKEEDEGTGSTEAKKAAKSTSPDSEETSGDKEEKKADESKEKPSRKRKAAMEPLSPPRRSTRRNAKVSPGNDGGESTEEEEEEAPTAGEKTVSV